MAYFCIIFRKRGDLLCIEKHFFKQLIKARIASFFVQRSEHGIVLYFFKDLRLFFIKYSLSYKHVNQT